MRSPGLKFSGCFFSLSKTERFETCWSVKEESQWVTRTTEDTSACICRHSCWMRNEPGNQLHSCAVPMQAWSSSCQVDRWDWQTFAVVSCFVLSSLGYSKCPVCIVAWKWILLSAEKAETPSPQKTNLGTGPVRRWSCICAFSLLAVNYPRMIGLLNVRPDVACDCVLFAQREWKIHVMSHLLNYSANTRWFKYDRDYLCVNQSQFVPVIFEPPCIY
jgi:hypothetical protein